MTDFTKYIDPGGCSCPYCGSDDLTSYPSNGDQIEYNVICDSCDKKWTDVYKLTEVIEAEE